MEDNEKVELLLARIEKWRAHVQVLQRMMGHEGSEHPTHAQRNGMRILYQTELGWLDDEMRRSLTTPIQAADVDDNPF